MRLPRRWDIPAPIPVDWMMRDLASAKITVREREDGRLEQTIEHAVLPGMTPAMMLWWLAQLEHPLEWNGRTVLAYRLWHPRDHIYFKVLGTFGPGCRFHVVEAFGGQRRFLMNWVFDVPKLDATGFRLEIRRLGRPVARIDESYEPVDGGLRYVVRMLVGGTGRVIGPLSRLIRRTKADTLHAWLRHNVEEVGNLPHVVPRLFAAR
ncbi:MAG: hypothetical protein HY271_05565 [Deltaproteobacteria bacterium]|nr:hypothetical protein [Deltaproteobacteria bacterium]